MNTGARARRIRPSPRMDYLTKVRAKAAALDRVTRPTRAQFGFEPRQLRRHLLADKQLRFGRAPLLGLLALGDARLRQLERLDEGILGAQRVPEQRIAEIRRVALATAAEGRAVRGRGGHDQGVVVLERIDESAGVAGRHDDDAPLDAGAVEHVLEVIGRQLVELQRRKLDTELVVAAAMTGQ